MTLDFTLEELKMLDKAIQQLPFCIAAPMLEKINKQLEEQRKVMDEPITLK